MTEDKECNHNRLYPHTPMRVYIYIHICCINNWKEVLDLLSFKIRDSGLYEIVCKIKCCVLGDFSSNISLFRDPKVEVIGISEDLGKYEPYTLNKLYEDACRCDGPFYVLYLHTKGVSHNGMNPNVIDWVNYLCYMNIYQYEKCLDVLSAGFSTVGVNLHETPVLHYSGNFWWATSTHIAKNGPCEFKIYQSPEFWITEKRIGEHACLGDSGVNHYHQPFQPSKYIRKDIVLTYVLPEKRDLVESESIESDSAENDSVESDFVPSAPIMDPLTPIHLPTPKVYPIPPSIITSTHPK